MCDNRKKPQIFYIQLAVSLDVSTLALLVLAFFGATDTLGQLSQRPLAVLGKMEQCWCNGWCLSVGRWHTEFPPQLGGWGANS